LPAIAILFVFSAHVTLAQQPDRRPAIGLGDAVVTGFSGTIALDPAKPRPANKSAIDLTFINPDGPSARVVGVGRPGYPWDGRLLQAPKTFDVVAKDTGQVFGVALDDQADPTFTSPQPPHSDSTLSVALLTASQSAEKPVVRAWDG
jgi:hypothetical protein